VGNINALRPLLFIFFVQVYLLFLAYQGRPALKTYTKEERDDALKGLALQLLMMRDNRLPATRKGQIYKSTPQLRAGRENSRSLSTSSPSLPGPDLQSPSSALSGTVSILRLLTDELMENAYINVYFKEETSQEDQIRRAKSMLRGSNPSSNAKPQRAGDVELADLAATDNPMHASITVLNQDFDSSCDTIQEFSHADCNAAAAEHLEALLSGLVNRLIATTTDNAGEDFWEVAGHSAVLQRFDLEMFQRSAMENPSRELSVLVKLLMKIYQLLQVHIRYRMGVHVWFRIVA
jgi:hypothetical protein